jgi:hypothetical protein
MIAEVLFATLAPVPAAMAFAAFASTSVTAASAADLCAAAERA